MKKDWYKSTFTKTMLIILEHVFVASLCICLLGLVILADMGIYLNNLGQKDALQTTDFQLQLFNASTNLLSEFSHYQQYQQLKAYEKTGIVDLDFSQNATLVEHPYFDNKSGFTYKVSDLLKWEQQVSDNFYQKDSSGRILHNDLPQDSRVIVCEKQDKSYDYYTQKDFIQLLNDGKLLLIPADTYAARDSAQNMRDLIYQLQTQSGYISRHNFDISYVTDEKNTLLYVDFWTYENPLIDEKYAPQGYSSLLELVQKDPDWNGRLSEVNDYLNTMLCNIRSIKNAKDFKDDYEPQKTNLRFCLINLDTKEVFTNMNGVTFSNYKEKILGPSALDFYFRITPDSMDCPAAFTDKVHYLISQANQVLNTHNYIYAIKLEEGLPVMDALNLYCKNYDRYYPYLVWLVVIGLLSLLLFFADLIWLTVIAGRNNKQEELILNSFDRWFTEPAAAIIILPWIFGMSLIYTAASFINNYTEYFLTILAMGLFTTPLFLCGYLSLVRRIKGGLLWRNSLLRLILRKTLALLSFFSHHVSIVLKTGLLVSTFLFFQLVGFAYTFNKASAFIIIMFFTDVIVLIYMMRASAGWKKIQHGLRQIISGDLQHQISMDHLSADQKDIAESINHIGEGLDSAIEDSLKNERTKTELITNVSHDIKTPLTSIINYVDLLNRENIEDDKIKGYLQIIDKKAQQLKVLTEDIVEASKASAGTLTLDMVDLNFVEMISQVMGEFQEKYEAKKLTMVASFPEEPATIHADGARMWRVLENIFGNVEKYAMSGTRVYIDLTKKNGKIVFSLKNISAQALNISADELTERFIRGDLSRNTEGSGLGLSIAKSLVELQKGSFRLYLDGDLFKVEIVF